MRAGLFALSIVFVAGFFAHAHAQEIAAPELAPSATESSTTAAELPPAAAESPPTAAELPPTTAELPPTAAEAPSAAPPGLSDAELQQLGFDSAEPATDYHFQLSGFVDFSTTIPMGQSKNLFGKPSFSIGNLNVYLSKNLSESVRTMAEIRFLYLPNGAPKSVTDRAGISTAVGDYNDFNRDLRWGGVEIERVYLEWAAHPLLTIRVGQFLTPYGVWNVDHGSPTIVSVQRPFAIGYNFFPERQTGFELYGRWQASNNGTVGYHVTLSNGTGPASEYLDLDNNKAIGGRLFWEYRKWGELKLGGSAYYGRNTNGTAIGSIMNGKLVGGQKITSQSDSLALALDATFKYLGVLVQAEFITQQAKFTPEGRTPTFSLATFANTIPADSFRFGGYLLLGYRFEWLGVMPYVVLQQLGGADATQTTTEHTFPMLVGVNIRPIESVVLKVEYTHVFFDRAQQFPGFDIEFVAFQMAWAF
jgi:hypothetical protein